MVRPYEALAGERGAWHQRITASLLHRGVPAVCVAMREALDAVAGAQLPGRAAGGGDRLRQISRLTAEPGPLAAIAMARPGATDIEVEVIGALAAASVSPPPTGAGRAVRFLDGNLRGYPSLTLAMIREPSGPIRCLTAFLTVLRRPRRSQLSRWPRQP